MNRLSLIIISLVAGIVLSVLSNWLYDILKPNLFPARPTLKRFVFVCLLFAPLLFIVGLPDFTFTNEIVTPDEKVIAAQQIQACIENHGMTQAHEVFSENGVRANTEPRWRFSFCDWPPFSYSDADGYSSITVDSVLTTEFNLDERPMVAMIAPSADIISSKCQRVRLSYKFIKQFDYEFYPSIEVDTGQVVHIRNLVFGENIVSDSQGFSLSSSALLGFYPGRNDLVVLHLTGDVLDTIECLK